jgi:hypothetical protein
MGILDETRFIERLQFFDGQRLFASDLQGADDFNREMRWRHNRSLHQPGIGTGYAVHGLKGDREVTIGAGYALDALGREIVLTNTVTQQVPPVAGDDAGEPVFYDLAVSYPDDSALEATETRQGICVPAGVVRRREVPVFCWIKLDGNGQPVDARLKQSVRTGMSIILARAEVLNCQLNRDLSIAERRSALPPRLPYIVCGEETPTDWNIFNLLEDDAQIVPEGFSTSGAFGVFVSPLGLTAKVDTSAAAFQVTPCYTARISGPRLKSVETTGEGEGEGEGRRFFAVDGLVSIRNETPSSFEADVMLIVQLFDRVPPTGSSGVSLLVSSGGGSTGEGEAEFRDAFLQLFEDWRVVWMGVEA